MYEVELVGQGEVERLMWQGDLFMKIFAIHKEWDAGVGFGQRDMQARIEDEAEARNLYERVQEIMRDSGMVYDLRLYAISYDDEQRFYDRDDLLDCTVES